MQLLLWVSVVALLPLTTIEAKKGISCFTCTSKVGQPTWCTRGSNKGKVKQCVGDSLNPANTCFKSVNKKTGEVNQGCAPASYNHGVVQKINTDFDGKPGTTTYLCNKDYCNTGHTSMPLMGLILASSLAFFLL